MGHWVTDCTGHTPRRPVLPGPYLSGSRPGLGTCMSHKDSSALFENGFFSTPIFPNSYLSKDGIRWYLKKTAQCSFSRTGCSLTAEWCPHLTQPYSTRAKGILPPQATNERLALQNGNASFGAPKGRIWWETSDQVGGFGLEAGDRPGMNHGRYISLGRRLRDSKFPWD